MKQYLQFQRLITFANNGDNLETFVRQFTVRVQEARDEGLDLPESLVAFILINGSKLSGIPLQSVFTGAEQAAR